MNCNNMCGGNNNLAWLLLLLILFGGCGYGCGGYNPCGGCGAAATIPTPAVAAAATSTAANQKASLRGGFFPGIFWHAVQRRYVDSAPGAW